MGTFVDGTVRRRWNTHFNVNWKTHDGQVINSNWHWWRMSMLPFSVRSTFEIFCGKRKQWAISSHNFIDRFSSSTFDFSPCSENLEWFFASGIIIIVFINYSWHISGAIIHFICSQSHSSQFSIEIVFAFSRHWTLGSYLLDSLDFLDKFDQI